MDDAGVEDGGRRRSRRDANSRGREQISCWNSRILSMQGSRGSVGQLSGTVVNVLARARRGGAADPGAGTGGVCAWHGR